jgi:hypothetical protein
MKTKLHQLPKVAANSPLWLAAFTLFAIATGSILFAQGHIFSGPGRPYDPKTRPQTEIQAAYLLAVARVGPATNRFYCVSASCLEKTLPSYAGWVFLFANTNGDRARVEVYFGSKDAYVPDAKSEQLLK